MFSPFTNLSLIVVNGSSLSPGLSCRKRGLPFSVYDQSNKRASVIEDLG